MSGGEADEQAERTEGPPSRAEGAAERDEARSSSHWPPDPVRTGVRLAGVRGRIRGDGARLVRGRPGVLRRLPDPLPVVGWGGRPRARDLRRDDPGAGPASSGGTPNRRPPGADGCAPG